MKLNRKAQRLVTLARETVFPPKTGVDPVEDTAQQRAVAVWRDLFLPFGPEIEDADILELGCDDGRLTGRLVTHGAARSAVGVETGAAFGPYDIQDGRVTLSDSLGTLDSLDDAAFDLILARELDSALPLDGLERRIGRLYELLRPGGEALMRVRCVAASPALGEGAGYGFLTPSAWSLLFLRSGFEIVDGIQVWRDEHSRAAADDLLDGAGAEERACAELRLHLVRPWESWELTALTPRRSKRRR